MTVNHGLYYVDLTASSKTQNAWPGHAGNLPKKNVFVGGKAYDFFLVYANADTEQTYRMYIGPGLTNDKFDKDKDVELIRANVVNAPFQISPGTGDCTILDTKYDTNTGLLTVKLNLKAFEKDFADAAKGSCVPKTFCDWNGSKCVGKADPPTPVGRNLTPDERNITCSYAGKDIDCPTGGCVGFRVKLPSSFDPQDQTTKQGIASKIKQCFPKANWDLDPKSASSELAGSCVTRRQ